jgi:hypothetical protein
MRGTRLLCGALLLGTLAAGPCRADDPPSFLNPLKGFVRSPFSAELEVYSGGITGKSIGEAFDSATRGDYGIRFTIGFVKALNLSFNYMYSDQSRSFTAVTPATSTLPTGTALMHSRNLSAGWGNGEINLAKLGRNTLYLSPGIGFVRDGSRDMTVITPFGGATSHILAGTAVSFNLGAGIKIYPFKHLGFRFDVRDYVSGGGTGSLTPQRTLVVSPICPVAGIPGCGVIDVPNPAQFFGPIPVQNNLVFTLGLIFKIL